MEYNEIENISILLSTIEIETTGTSLLPVLPIPLIHYIFDTYIGIDYKLLIHKEGSTDEDRSKVLSIELIMICKMEDYFQDVLLSDKFIRKLCSEACKRGYLNILAWARENGCPWDSSTCCNAAKNGHLNILQWARQNGCPWDSDTCTFAARSGHLNCLIWARQNGCDWNSDTCKYAAMYDYLNCLQWAHKNGCPWDKIDCLKEAVSRNHTEMITWIIHVDLETAGTSNTFYLRQ
jgi:hypothetical protein